MLEERRGSWAMSSSWYSAEEESDAAAVVSQAERLPPHEVSDEQH